MNEALAISETMMPFISVLPFGLAMLLAALGMAPSLVIAFRAVVCAGKKSPNTMQWVIAGVAALIGAWAFLNAATPLLVA